jgi:predicted porin
MTNQPSRPIRTKTIAGAGMLLTLAASPALAQSSVTVSGVADLAARYVSHGGLDSVKSLVSGSNATSRLIVRGTEDLGGGMAASFWLEHGIAMDTGSQTGAFFDRRSTLSLTGKTWGEVRLGRDYVPTYIAWVRHDVFGYLGVAGSNNLFGATPLGPTRSTWGTAANTTVRSSNSVQYFLPGSLGGFEGSVMVAAAEGSTVADTKVLGGRLGWSGGGFSASLAHTVSSNSNTASGKFKDTVLAGRYDFGGGRVNLAWRQLKQNASEHTVIMATVLAKAGPGDIKLSAVKANMAGRVGTTSIDANDALQLGVGYVYNLSRRTVLYTSLSRISNDGVATFAIPGGAAGIAGGQTSSGLDVGIRHTF